MRRLLIFKRAQIIRALDALKNLYHHYIMYDLTRRQIQVFNFIASYMQNYTLAPTLQAICRGVGLNQPIEASRYLTILINKKYLARDGQTLIILKCPPRDASKHARAIIKAHRQQELRKEAGLRLSYNAGYKRGFKEAKKRIPKDRLAAFERGANFGRKEAIDELTMESIESTVATSKPPAFDTPRVLPFLRRSD